MTPNPALLFFRIYDILALYVIRFTSKRSLARLLSTFLCCVVVVIRPFSALGGPYCFLVLALKELVFSVQASLAQQLELTVLNILGALLGIAVSTLAKFIASRSPEDSARARATCAIFLILISFFGALSSHAVAYHTLNALPSPAGLTKSRLPRLQLSTRISCFVSTWILTNDIGVPSVSERPLTFHSLTDCMRPADGDLCLHEFPLDYAIVCYPMSCLAHNHHDFNTMVLY